MFRDLVALKNRDSTRVNTVVGHSLAKWKHYTGSFHEWNSKEKLLVSMACIVPSIKRYCIKSHKKL